MKSVKIGLIAYLLFAGIGLQGQPLGQKDSLQKVIQLEDVVVTAQYAPTDAENAVYEVRVIKAIDIQKQGLNNLAEVLDRQLNLRVSTDPILGNGLSIQGIGGENIQVMIDGVPIIGRVGGNIDLSQINLQNVDRIEIVEGAMSAQYGSNASGGVINIITKKSQINKFQIESKNHYENVGILSNSLSLGVRNKKLFVSLTGSRFSSQFADEDSLRLYETRELPNGESFRTRVNPWNPKLQYGIDGLIRYQISDSTNLVYQYRRFDEELSIFGEIRRPQFRPYAFDEIFQTLRQDHSLTLETYLGKIFYLKSNTGYNEYDRLSKTQRLDFEPDTTSLVLGGQDSSYFTAILHRSSISTLSESALNGQVGIEALYETGSGGRIIDSSSFPLNEAQLGNYAAWLGLKFQPVQQFVLSANLRYGYNSKYKHPLIPSFHASWKSKKNWDLKFSYAHGFRAPSLKELHFNFIDINHYIIGNPDLGAEKSKNISFSLGYEKTQSQDRTLRLSGKLFYNKIKERITLAEFAPIQYNYQNIDRFETHGFNLRASYQLGKKVKIQSAYAFTRLYNLWSDDFEADKFIALPEMQNDIQVNIPRIETNLTISHRFIGKRIRFYQDDEGNLAEGYVGKYHLLHATASRFFWKERFFFSLGVKNLLDTQTVPLLGQGGGAHSGAGSSLLLGWGRTYFIRMNIKLYKRGF